MRSLSNGQKYLILQFYDPFLCRHIHVNEPSLHSRVRSVQIQNYHDVRTVME